MLSPFSIKSPTLLPPTLMQGRATSKINFQGYSNCLQGGESHRNQIGNKLPNGNPSQPTVWNEGKGTVRSWLIFPFFKKIFYYSGFCHTLKWISHGFTCIPHPDPPLLHRIWQFFLGSNLTLPGILILAKPDFTTGQWTFVGRHSIYHRTYFNERNHYLSCHSN